MPFPPGQFWSRNVEPVAYLDLGGKPGFKMALHKAGERWFFYVAHLWEPGWSIVDVTDAAKPRYVRFMPGPANTWTIQIQIAEGHMITGLEKIPDGWEADGVAADKSFEEGFYIWSLSDPENPARLGHYRTGGDGTHRNYYAGGRYVHA
ncbi:MAG: LVIVD repeat-containing protein, partial [Alphaproteobacteria bacterium]